MSAADPWRSYLPISTIGRTKPAVPMRKADTNALRKPSGLAIGAPPTTFATRQ